MRVIRSTFLLLCIVLFVGGYAGSQLATWTGRTESFYKAFLQPGIQTLSWAVVALALVLFFAGNSDKGQDES